MTDLTSAPTLDCVTELISMCTLVAFATCSGQVVGQICLDLVLSQTCCAQPVPRCSTAADPKGAAWHHSSPAGGCCVVR